ncbi:MAG: hypothetical protein J6I62_04180 [Selenomonadaceae bacterium]|nr:hypothetical protein [Selenomonadaceae bacterium]
MIMNLTFDLQLFTGTSVTLSTGISGGNREYTIQDVELNTAFATASSLYANFKVDSTAAFGLKGEWGNGLDKSSIIGFGGADEQKSPTIVGLFGGKSYTWNFASTKITSVSLGANANLNVISAPSAKLGVTLDSSAGQKINFTANSTAISLATNDGKIISGNLSITGGKSDLSLLNGSSISGATVEGGAGEVVTLASKNADKNVFNLKGSASEAVVTIGGSGQSTVHSASLVGFDKITFDAKKATKAEISLAGIKDSGVSILGSSVTGGNDTIVIGQDLKGSTVSINGSGGKDEITLSGTGSELIIMDSVAGSGDTVTGWISSNKGKDEGNTLKIDGLMSTFYVKDATGSKVIVGQSNSNMDSTAATQNNNGTTLMSSNTGAPATYAFGVNVKASDDTYAALLVGSKKLTSVQGVKFDNFSYVIADENKELLLGDTDKTKVVLANTTDEKHWGDDYNVYQNIVTVQSSTKGKSLIINGVVNESITASLSGTADSLWGANNIVGDEIYLKKEKNQVVFTGGGDGLDSIKEYEFGTSLSKANAVRFLDGVNYISAGSKSLTIGADASNAVEVTFVTGTGTSDSIAYGFGLEGDKYVAAVDTSAKGNGAIGYGSDVNVYIGQGNGSYISVDSAAKDVKLGWDGGAGYVSIDGVNAAMAADGAVIVGTTDNAQSISGSSRGASSISGGFVADKWTDDNADTLVGGGVSTRTTTFFVGEDMGKDEIQNLSSKDNIVFLGTKYEDLVNFNPEGTDAEFTFKFANNNVIEATAVGNKLSAIKDVSLYFDDGTYIWNGSTIEKAE